MGARGRPPALKSGRELVELLGRALVEVDVLAELLAAAIRSNAPDTPAAAALEADVEAIPRRFADVLEPLVAPPRPPRRRRPRR